MNILFIGNSYTYFNDLPAVFSALANENGKHVTAHSVTRGGRKLNQFMDTEDDCTKELGCVLADNPPYDAVFMQEQSLLPALDHDAFLSGVTFVKRMADTRTDRFILYTTWARKLGSPDLDTHGWSRVRMTLLLDESYRRAGKALDIPVSPVGINFWKVISAHPELDLHAPDLSCSFRVY